MSGLFGGGSPAPAPAGPTSGTTTTFTREAPEIEARKLALYDEALNLSKQPIEIPAYQVAPLTPLEQQAMESAGQFGTGQATTLAGIGSILGANVTASGAPDIDRFLNPFQSYVVDEINRQSEMAKNKLSAQAVQSGAFGGGREGVQQAEAERARLSKIGEVQALGFDRAVQAAQNQQQLQAQTGLQAGAQLGQLGQIQQAQQQKDVAQAAQLGGLQRQIQQQALQAQRQTEIARAYEPFQRAEFQKGIMTTLPTAASQITAGTGPGVNPFAQAAQAGLGAYATYNLIGPGGNVGPGTQRPPA
tara:strand:+ start:262 stop:1170 length:909 start_codon:yes stop_codon:yes gene_type:complete